MFVHAGMVCPLPEVVQKIDTNENENGMTRAMIISIHLRARRHGVSSAGGGAAGRAVQISRLVRGTFFVCVCVHMHTHTHTHTCTHTHTHTHTHTLLTHTHARTHKYTHTHTCTHTHTHSPHSEMLATTFTHAKNGRLRSV